MEIPTNFQKLTNGDLVWYWNMNTRSWEHATFTGVGEHKGHTVAFVTLQNGSTKFGHEEQIETGTWEPRPII